MRLLRIVEYFRPDHSLHIDAMLFAFIIGLLGYQVLENRNPRIVREFETKTGYPHGRPGYVADHIIPLCAGGPDEIQNLQWQEVKFSYLKDRFERDLCKAMHKQGYKLVKVQ